MLKKKKASMTLLFLAVFIMFYTLFGIYLNIRTSYEFYNRFETAVIETANFRAQAVDTYLKESVNIIESFHPLSHADGTPYATADTPDVEHDKYKDELPYGHEKIYNPDEVKYVEAYNNANQVAKAMFVRLMNHHISDSHYDNLPFLDEENICIQVKALPKTGTLGSTRTNMDFTCTATVDGKPYTFEKKLAVSTLDDPKIKKFVFDPNGTPGDEDDVYTQVVNVVFVGGVVKHSHILSNFFSAMGEMFPLVDDYQYVIKASYSLAYPESDRCFGDLCTDKNYYYDIKQ